MRLDKQTPPAKLALYETLLPVQRKRDSPKLTVTKTIERNLASRTLWWLGILKLVFP